jgi:repressor LexA
MAITPKQKAVFEYIKDYIVENEFSPTFEEIAHRFKYKSKGTVYKHIKALKLKGLIRQEWNRVRSIELTGNRKKTANFLPLKGEWREDGINWKEPRYSLIGVPVDTVHNNNTFLIYIKTKSLDKYNIIMGDYIIVDSNKTKKSTGPIIVENKTGAQSLQSASWNRDPNQIIGQLSGVFRVF